MGCLQSKKLMENVSNVHSRQGHHIEEVFRYDKNLDVSRFGSSEKEIQCDIRYNAGTNTADKIKAERLNKTNKFKTKYDNRITAKYDIKALIGTGTFSKVVRVENRLTKQPYAIKIIESKDGKEAFEAELAILRRVKCPFIITLIEVFESVDKIYMVMELATGGDLFDKIVTLGTFCESDAVKVLKMVLEGVKCLHTLGITHRDFKPDNLLYYHPGTDSRLMITDFGLAHTRRSAHEVNMSTICGTPEYIAPEIVAQKPYTNAVDLWAIGVITYILLRGDFPFFDNNRINLYKKILKGNYNLGDEVWSDISVSGRDFVTSLLTVDPDKRLSAVEALEHPWIVANYHSPRRKESNNSPDNSWGRKTSSSHSSNSRRSNISASSLRTGRRRVRPTELDTLHHPLHSAVAHSRNKTIYSS